MLSIVIADDEVGIIGLCRMLIEYPDAKVIGEAHNGLELFDVIGKLRPNTVITDINMPGMTGLELISKAQASYPDVNFIIMSGYTDFEYVQTALRFGVWDYLLKPLQKAELNRVLKKLDQHLLGMQAQSQQQELIESDLQESLSMLQSKYLQDMWEGRPPSPPPEMNGKPILDFFGKKLQCLVFLVENPFAARAAETRSLVQQEDNIMDTIRRLAADGGLEAFCFSGRRRVVCLLLYPDRTAETQWEKLRRDVERITRNFNSQSSMVQVTGGASLLLLGGAPQIPRLLDQARSALRYRLEMTGHALLVYQAKNDADLEALPGFGKESELRDAVLRLDGDRACAIVAQAGLGDGPAVPGGQFRLTEQILQCLNDSLGLLPGADEMDGGPPRLHIEDVLSGKAAGAVLGDHIQAGLRNALAEYKAFFTKRENNVILKAKRYAARHLVENISLNDVAKYVCLSPAYFSTLFKSETGISFIKYLQKLRVDQAKKLLQQSNMRIQDIAEAVGYHDLKFFNKVFLSETSVTPSEYRKFYS